MLECAQRRIMKLVKCLENKSYKKWLRDLGLFSLEKGRLKGDLYNESTSGRYFTITLKEVVARWGPCSSPKHQVIR